MLVRFYPDVLALRPAAVVIFAGTNDIARNNGPQTLEMVQQNIMAMTELAQAHGVKVVLALVMPTSDRTWRCPPGVVADLPLPARAPHRGRASTRAAAAGRYRSLQRVAQDLCPEKGAVIADYHSATVDAQASCATASPAMGSIRTPRVMRDGLRWPARRSRRPWK